MPRDYKKNPLNMEDRDMFDKLKVQVTRLIHNKKSRDAVLKKMESNPVEQLPDAAVFIFKRIESYVKESGEMLDDAIKMLIVSEIVKQLLQLIAAKRNGEVSKDQIQSFVAKTVQKLQSDSVQSNRDQAAAEEEQKNQRREQMLAKQQQQPAQQGQEQGGLL